MTTYSLFPLPKAEIDLQERLKTKQGFFPSLRKLKMGRGRQLELFKLAKRLMGDEWVIDSMSKLFYFWLPFNLVN